jgi:phospholipase C
LHAGGVSRVNESEVQGDAPGVLNLVSGNTNGATNISIVPPAADDVVADGAGGFSVINDAQPAGDLCTGRENLSLPGKNVGDLLNAAGVTWGNFAGGFDLHGGGQSACTSQTHSSVTGVFVPKVDYIPHHEGFQYYASTANPMHLRPSSVALIGQTRFEAHVCHVAKLRNGPYGR